MKSQMTIFFTISIKSAIFSSLGKFSLILFFPNPLKQAPEYTFTPLSAKILHKSISASA